MFVFLFTASFAHSESFRIDSFYYIDSAPKPNEIDSKIVFTVDREVSCDGKSSNKIFINKDSYKSASTPYYLTRFWPSYFLKQAALVNAEVDVDFGRYDQTLAACEVGFRYLGNSAEKWFEPHEFTVSEYGDANPINKVYYQLYINTRSPTYAPWVYADTDYEVSCDGVTTNRIVPTTNPNELGYEVPGEFGSQVNAYYSSENTRSFFDLLSGKIDHYSVGRYVLQINACMIYDVQFSENNISLAATEIGKRQCIDDPATCNLFSGEEVDLAWQLGLQDGIDECIALPESCGLFDQAEIESSFSAGVNAGEAACIDDPESCSLFDQESMDYSLAQGVFVGEQNCQNSPELCDLFNQTDIESALAEGATKGIESCQESPETCELYDQLAIEAAILSGELKGKTDCIAEPGSCDLFDQEDVDIIAGERLTGAINEIANLLPKGILKSVCKKHPNSLLCVNASLDHENHGHDKHKKGRGHDKHDHD